VLAWQGYWLEPSQVERSALQALALPVEAAAWHPAHPQRAAQS
jgi:hypothetical protein